MVLKSPDGEVPRMLDTHMIDSIVSKALKLLTKPDSPIPTFMK